MDEKDNPQQNQAKVLTLVKENWFIVIFIGGIIASWVRFGGAIENHEIRIEKVESAVEQSNANYNDLKGSLIEVKTILNERLPAK